ncbi:hypothetical protein DCO58_12490 [Helicobacter saguini]|uniref:Protein hydE n=1 Tax=Helicobacter saguini TaxID=1548018 RepID=A0A347VZA1_9HELI|nr:hypothetical protein [Helicobacter saguini]MWV60893.1 hypothetical protein [Helicobacter saguini]MWV68439.1 hypothetical protein [Helicobacter saguini]MWV70097.1 hypothetical protein [Helicobacter saguini]MWV72000.1 hypothetical protein [Helicobacter saguini]TLD91656.1 hypothetical protein LS64_011540 [Helicobacter saguini]
MSEKEQEIIVINEMDYSIESAESSGFEVAQNDNQNALFTFKMTQSKSANNMIFLLKNIVLEFLDSIESSLESAEFVTKITIKYKIDSIESTQNSQKFFIFMQGSSKNILDFSNALSDLPLSLNFTFQNLEFISLDSINIETFCDFSESSFIEFATANLDSKNIIPSIKDLQNIKQNYELIRNFITIKSKDSIESILENLAKKLVENKKIIIQKDKEIFELFIDKELLNLKDSKKKVIESKALNIDNIPHVMFADLYNATSYLRISDIQKQILASLENIEILLALKSAFVSQFRPIDCKNIESKVSQDSKDFNTEDSKSKNSKNHNFLESKNTILASLPNDCFLMLLFDKLQKNFNIDFAFFKSLKSAKNAEQIDISYTLKYHLDSNLQIVASSESGRFVPLKYAHTDLSGFLNNQIITQNKKFIILLSSRNNSLFWLYNLKGNAEYSEILNISFSTNLATHLKTLYTYQNGDKLLKNFALQHAGIAQTWGLDSNFASKIGLDSKKLQDSKQFNTKNIESNNLIDIFTLIEKLLNLPQNLLIYANNCVRERGPRIDFKLVKISENISLDYARILRSVLSFYLAGVEVELIAFGVIESLCEFIGTLCGDMLTNYGVSEVFACGDILTNQTFLDKIIYAIPKNISLNLPTNAIDFSI